MKKVLKIVGLSLAVLVVALVAAVLIMASRFETKFAAPDTPYPQVTVSSDPAVIARGEYLVRTVGHCTQCHGDYPREQPEKNTPDVPLTGGFKFEMGPLATLYSPNLTPDVDTGIGKRSDEEIARAIATGVLPDGRLSLFMAFAANFSAEDLSAVVSYLRSLPPVKKEIPPNVETTLGKAVFSLVDVKPDTSPLPSHVEASEEPSLARGEYLAEHAAMCVFCHTALDPMTVQVVGAKAAGSLPDPSKGPDTDKEFVAPNLTSDPQTGITGKLSEDELVARLKHGRAYPSSVMPWENLSRMSESDMRSIYRYLKTLPPVVNDVGPTYRERGWKPAS